MYTTSRSIHQARPEIDIIEQLLTRHSNDSRLDRRLGSAYGQALGDAYGLSTEFEDRYSVASMYKSDHPKIPFPNYIQTQHSVRWKRGDWTDDTDQWILIFDTILSSGDNEKEFARRLKKWIERGYPELGDFGGMGIGAHVHQVVSSPGFLENPIQRSYEVWERGGRKSAPNGAVMRCSASAYFHSKDTEKLIHSTMKMCQVTHTDPRCIASCLAICLLVGYLIENRIETNQIEELAQFVRNKTLTLVGKDMTPDGHKEFLWYTDAARTLEDFKLDESNTIGYTYKCLGSGFYGLRSNESFQTTINKLIIYGGDADTNAAVCGTVYGARHGYSSLPKEWLAAMPYKKWLDAKIASSLQPPR